ncbi:MAG: ATP-binding protein [Bifidobacteriaceae bacterium]|nr:ATP-binding protein [Bifidobacteriaceae bacterium]
MTTSGVITFIVFGLIALTIIIIVCFSFMEWLRPLFKHLPDVGEEISDWWRSLTRKRKRDSQTMDSDSDELDKSAASLLSMMKTIAVVVDETDDVVRASPAAYSLGVVDDDSIANATILDYIHEVRKQGGKRSFELVTQTPQRYVSEEIDKEIRSQYDIDDAEGMEVNAVTRPNWLKVIVGRISDKFVVVLIDDESDLIRFNQLREEFVVNVSERIVKPVEAMEELADTLEHEQLDVDQIHAQAKKIRLSSRHLNHMVHDLMLLIRAQNKIVPSESNCHRMQDIFDSVLEHVQGDIERNQAHVYVDCAQDLQIHGDAEQIRVAITKLLRNAMLYSPVGANVNVVAQLVDNQVVIRVIDCGVGIAREEQPRIFERFYRANNQSERTQDGVGLGLAIVKHIALTHNGSVSIWSMPGQGSTFTLVFPQ